MSAYSTHKRGDMNPDTYRYGEKELYVITEENDTLLSSTDPEKGAAQIPISSGLHKVAVDALCVVLNTACTVLLVFVNKAVFTDPQLRKFQLSTAAWHFMATSIVLMAASSRPFNLFKSVKLPMMDVLPISVLFVGFLVLGNLSLALNPVPFYQMARILTTPCVVALNFIIFRKRIAFSCLTAILISCFGVMLTVSDFALSNSVGIIVAILSFVTTALYQIWIGKKITDLNVSASQLLLNQAPLSVLLLMSMAPFFDTKPVFSEVNTQAWQMFFLSGLLAAGLNLSQFLIIGRTSALTFNIVSNLKNIIIITYGWHQTGKDLGFMDVAGISLALSGAFAYSWLCHRFEKD